MGSMDRELIRYLNDCCGSVFTTISFGAGETEAEVKFILELKEEVLSKGISVIVDNYTSLTAFFVNIPIHEPNVPIAVFEILHHGLQVLRQNIATANGSLENLEADKLQEWKAPLAVIFHLLYKCYNTFSTLVLVTSEPDDLTRPTTGKTGKKATKAKTHATNYPYWYEWETKLFDVLSQIINQPYKTLLWNDADSNFMNSIVQACSAIMRKTPREVLYDAKYLKTVVDLLKNLWIVHNMRQEVLVALMLAIDKSDGACKLVASIAKELAENGEIPYIALYVLDRCYKTWLAGKPGISEKSLAGFITEVAELSPQLATANLPVMVNMLHGDSTILRGAVLLSAGSILKSTFSTVELPQTQTLRGHLVRTALMHVNDMNINVRAKAISVFTKLMDEKALLLDEIIKALNVISRKVSDKAPSVRKSAINFFRAIGNGNPILTKFSLASIQMKLKTHLEKYFESMVEGVECQESVLKFVAKKFVDEIHLNDYGFDKLELPEEMNTPEKSLAYIGQLLKDKLYWRACEAAYIGMDRYSATEIEQGQGRKESPAQYFVIFKSYFPDMQGPNDVELELGTIGESERTKHAEGRVNYYKGMKKLKIAFEASFSMFCRILEIGTPTDRKDTINLFATYCEDGFIPTRELTNSIMSAFGKVDEKLASDLIDAFFRIFIPGILNSSQEIANRLVNLVSSMSTDNKGRLITLFQQMFKDTKAMKNCVKELWSIYGERDVERSKAAVYLLGVKGSLDQKLFFEWIQPMINVGLGKRGRADFTLATACCNALLIMYESCVSKNPDGLFEYHLLYEKLEKIIKVGLDDVDTHGTDQEYCDLVDVAIRLIYYVCNNPMVIMLEIVSYLELHVFPENFQNNPVITESKIKRYAALASVIIDCHVYFYEVIVMDEIKERKALIEQRKYQKNMQPPPAPGNPKQPKGRGRGKKLPAVRGRLPSSDQSLGSSSTTVGDEDSTVSIQRMSRRNMSTNDTVNKLNEMEEMLGVEDREFDRVRDYLDSLVNEGFMSQIRIHIISFCKCLDLMSYPTQVTCIELLTKTMCINTYAMTTTMPCFLALWEQTNCPYLKVELIKSAIYINMRFPNSMEQCNKLIITGLQNENVHIRVATLDFIIYLCLSEVIKPKAYLVESSICLNDAHLPIRDAAQDFFVKMSEKTNIVYNTIPEIITFLTKQKDIALPEYQQMMKFLLTKLKKPANLSGLIETLVGRFKTLEAGRPRQDNAYCLSLLNYNDKTFRIIEEQFSSISDKLDDDEVYNCFLQVVSNAKKNCTKDYMITVEKFETMMKEWKENCNRREGHSRVLVESMLQEREAIKKKTRKNRKGNDSSESEESSEFSSLSGDEKENEGRKKNRKIQNQNGNAASGSKEPNDDDNEAGTNGNDSDRQENPLSREESIETKAGVKKLAKKAKQLKLTSSESEDSSDHGGSSGDEEQANQKEVSSDEGSDGKRNQTAAKKQRDAPASEPEDEDVEMASPSKSRSKTRRTETVAPMSEGSEEEMEVEMPIQKGDRENKKQKKDDQSKEKALPTKNRRGRKPKPKVVSEEEDDVDIPNVFSDSD